MCEQWEVVKSMLDSNPEGRSAKQIANYLSVSLPFVYKWGQPPDGAGDNMPVKYIIPFTLYTGDFRLIQFLAAECGLMTFLVPKATGKLYREVAQEITAVVKKFSEFLSSVSESSSDGKIQPDECEVIDKGGREAIAQIMRVIKFAENEVKKNG